MKNPILRSTLLASAVALSACSTADESDSQTANASGQSTVTSEQNVTAQQVVSHYAALAHAKYSDSLNAAQKLQADIQQFLDAPTEANLEQARNTWVDARVPYQQSEVYRFGNSVVDDWEGKVNAWPLDEGLIDYTANSYGEESEENPFYTANIIANPKLMIGGKTVDASTIDKTLLSETLHEIDGVEANVATGYHAIEFLLWGQDLNGTQPGAGQRPATDYDLENCTNGNCDRRRAYLSAVTGLLIDDLKDIVASWEEGGAAMTDLNGKGTQGGLATIVTGMGSLAYGELAGERMKLGLMLHDPEEEHDCFSDNTHWSHYYDAKGIRNVYEGRYIGNNGETLEGPSLAALVAQTDPTLNREMEAKLAATEAAMQVLVEEAAKGNTVDVLIGAGNTAGNQKMQDAIDALVAQTRTLEKVIKTLDLQGISLEGSDSLDNPSAVL